MTGRVGVVLATYGSPPSLDEVGPYLEHILGRAPTKDQVAALRDQYEAVGGVHHLPETTRRQAELLQAGLADRPGEWTVRPGYKHAAPFIGDAVRDLAADVERGVLVPLAPHYNTMSVAGYHDAARRGLADLAKAPPFSFVRSYHRHPLLIDAWVDRIEPALDRLDGDARILFTAHSLPTGVRDRDDPYEDQLLRTCRMIAEDLGTDDWDQVWQSAPDHGDWLGPDVCDAIADLAGTTEGVVVAPVGFVADHMETRYDLDVEAARAAADAGLAFERVPCLNDDDRFIRLLAEVAVDNVPA